MLTIKISLKNYYIFSIPVDFNLSWLKILLSNHLIVVLETQGYFGFGEAVLYKTSLLKVNNLIKKEVEFFFKEEFSSFKEARTQFFKKFNKYLDLVCAFDLAMWDIEGKMMGKNVSQLIGKKINKKVFATEQIFIPNNELQLVNDLTKILKNGTKYIKLKAGRDFFQDKKNIKLINRISKKKINIQLDLNQGLNFKQAIIFGRQYKKLGILIWEEPIKFSDFYELNKLIAKTNLKIILDESVKNEHELKLAINKRAINILNIKTSRLGGITGALNLIKICKKNKIEIEIGCSEELGIGTAAQIQTAYCLENLRSQEGLGASRLGFDIINEKINIKNGYFSTLFKKTGLGISLNYKKLINIQEKYRSVFIEKDKNQSILVYQEYLKNRLINKYYNAKLLIEKLFINVL